MPPLRLPTTPLHLSKHLLIPLPKLSNFLTNSGCSTHLLDRDWTDLIALEFQKKIQYEPTTRRPPVVTIMGHVDHGKTTLLDYLRNAQIAKGEPGGITQHIGAFNVELEAIQKNIKRVSKTDNKDTEQQQQQSTGDSKQTSTYNETGRNTITTSKARGRRQKEECKINTDSTILKPEKGQEELQTSITFLDTPGHAAFTNMRLRGAQCTDIVVLVVAADDSIKPQTKEAVDHAIAAAAPIIVAITKCDRVQARPQKVKLDLIKLGVVVEEEGGEVQAVEVSAKTGFGISDLLESILVLADVLDIKATEKGQAQGIVLESNVDKGLGPLATVLITNGTLSRNSYLISGLASGRSRILRSSGGVLTDSAGPGMPVQVVGWKSLPEVGATVEQIPDETTQKQMIDSRIRDAAQRQANSIAAEQHTTIEVSTIEFIVKADVSGSVEALVPALMALSTPKINIKIIHASVGDMSESDASLAAASKAKVICFNSGISSRAAELILEKAAIQVIESRIIYSIIDDVKRIIRKVEYIDEEHWTVVASAEVQQVIPVADRKLIAGCVVKSGTIARSGLYRIVRDKKQIYEGRLASLKHFKKDVNMMKKGGECGLAIAGFETYIIGDSIEMIERAVFETPE